LFLDDLKNKKDDQVDFSYNLGNAMKIDVQKIKEEKKQKNLKEFELLK
jgi:hypothetical protein